MKHPRYFPFSRWLMLVGLATSSLAQAASYYVSPDGDDNATGSVKRPLESIQYALDIAQPGDTINLLPGDYYEHLETKRNGDSDAPITISGTPEAVLRGDQSQSRVFEIHHNHYIVNGFTINGYDNQGPIEQPDSYRDILLYVENLEAMTTISGLTISHMRFQNALGECLRLRYFVQDSEIAYSQFSVCGAEDFVFNGGGKNGEAIYIGTSLKQWYKNPTDEPDMTNGNWIHHNTINSRGGECIDIKEGASDNLIEFNSCTGSQDADSGAINVRGNNNIIRNNSVYGNVGAGIRLGASDDRFGKDNAVYDNVIYDNDYAGLKVVTGSQGIICSNDMHNANGEIRGGYRKDYDPESPCP